MTSFLHTGGIGSPIDLAAFERLVAEATPRLFRLAARLLSSTHEAEDVVQESFYRAFAAFRAGRFDGRSQPITWLYSIVTHVAVSALREKKRRARREDAWQPRSSNAEHSLDARVELVALAKLLEGLPEDQRAALVLKEFEGLPIAEIAVIMSCSVGAAEQRIFRARATLRERANR